MARPSLLERGMRSHGRRLPESSGRRIDIHAGDHTIESILVVPGNHEMTSYQIEEASQALESFDFLVASDELIAGGQKVEPQKGWLFYWPLENQKGFAVYKALAREGENRVFDISDAYGITYRVHTKFDRIERNP